MIAAGSRGGAGAGRRAAPGTWVLESSRPSSLVFTAAALQSPPKEENSTEAIDAAQSLQQLIDERKAIPSSDGAKRCQISKDTRKEIEK